MGTLRTSSAALIAIVMVLALAGPAAADEPERSDSAPEPFEIPAGAVCDFDLRVAAAEGFRTSVKEHRDGRVQTHFRGERILTNLDTDTTITEHISVKVTETPTEDEEGELLIEYSGRGLLILGAGDEGPFGTATGSDGLIAIRGHATAVLDLASFTFTSFELSGQATDVCAALAG